MFYDYMLHSGPLMSNPNGGFSHISDQGVPIFLDESLLDMLEDLNDPWETRGNQMFNPLIVQDQTFTVEVIKQDGTTGTITGKLVAPNYEGSKNELMAYTIDLLEKDIVPIYTDKGWRSFYTNKVISFKFGG